MHADLPAPAEPLDPAAAGSAHREGVPAPAPPTRQAHPTTLRGRHEPGQPPPQLPRRSRVDRRVAARGEPQTHIAHRWVPQRHYTALAGKVTYSSREEAAATPKTKSTGKRGREPVDEVPGRRWAPREPGIG